MGSCEELYTPFDINIERCNKAGSETRSEQCQCTEGYGLNGT